MISEEETSCKKKMDGCLLGLILDLIFSGTDRSGSGSTVMGSKNKHYRLSDARFKQHCWPRDKREKERHQWDMQMSHHPPLGSFHFFQASEAKPWPNWTQKPQKSNLTQLSSTCHHLRLGDGVRRIIFKDVLAAFLSYLFIFFI